jgi:RNA polymerase sigma-70 factor (ECF subfamily)
MLNKTSTSDKTDQDHLDLLRKVATRGADSEVAMTQLYRALSGSVFAFVRRRLGYADDHEVQAVVVDAMYEVWRAAANFAGGSQVKTWVLGIARHKLLDAVRKNPNTAYSHDDIADYAESLADESADVVAALAEKQRMHWLMFCMDKLPCEQRESLHLLLVEGLSVEAIAHVQGCPNGTVKTRVFHAKAKLKTCLARWLEQKNSSVAG